MSSPDNSWAAITNGDLRQLRADLATVTVERDEWRRLATAADKRAELVLQTFGTECAAHEETGAKLEEWQEAFTFDSAYKAKNYRAALAKAEARVKELEPVLAAASAVSRLLDNGEMADSLLEALQNAVDVADGETD